MNETTSPAAEQQYIRTLRNGLADLPRDRRDMFIADVQAHIDETTDGGIALESALASLGSPKQLAERAHREISLAVPSVAAGARAARILTAGAVAVGVMTAAVIAFFVPFTQAVDRVETGGSGDGVALVTIAQEHGPWIALLGLVPAALAAGSLWLPRRAGRIVLLALAVLMTAIIAAGLTLGSWFAPFTILLWACVLVPQAVSRGLDLSRARGWRVAIAVAAGAPAFLFLVRTSIAPNDAGLVLAIAAGCALLVAALVGIGARFGYFVLAASGALLMVASGSATGWFSLPLWWAGGLYLTLGIVAVVASRVRSDREAQQ